MPPTSYNALTHRQKNICEYGGVFGVLLTLTCLIQHMTVTIVTDITKIMLPGYVFAIASFTLLGFQKSYAVILLIISGVYSAITEYQWMRHDAFSLVVLLLFMYHVIIIVVVYAEQIPERLKQKELAKKREEDEWRGKI